MQTKGDSVKSQHWDGLVDTIETRLRHYREAAVLNDAQVAHEVAHAVLGYLERLPPTWRYQ